jgi:hypothetical protein
MRDPGRQLAPGSLVLLVGFPDKTFDPHSLRILHGTDMEKFAEMA